MTRLSLSSSDSGPEWGKVRERWARIEAGARQEGADNAEGETGKFHNFTLLPILSAEGLPVGRAVVGAVFRGPLRGKRHCSHPESDSP